MELNRRLFKLDKFSYSHCPSLEKTEKPTWGKNRFSLFWKQAVDDLLSIRVSPVFQL